MKVRNYQIVLFLFGFLILVSCASIKLPPQGGIVKETYTRTFAAEFTSFHPRINTALQGYAQKHKGNAFQIVRLGGDSVVIQGRYKRDGDADRYFATLTAKPSGKQKTAVQIKISSSSGDVARETLERAAADLFRIVETEAGVPAVN